MCYLVVLGLGLVSNAPLYCTPLLHPFYAPLYQFLTYASLPVNKITWKSTLFVRKYSKSQAFFLLRKNKRVMGPGDAASNFHLCFWVKVFPMILCCHFGSIQPHTHAPHKPKDKQGSYGS